MLNSVVYLFISKIRALSRDRWLHSVRGCWLWIWIGVNCLIALSVSALPEAWAAELQNLLRLNLATQNA